MDTINLHNKVASALQSIDTISRAEAPPFFYTKLHAKLNKPPNVIWWQQLFTMATKPAFSIMALSLFLVLDITAITIVINEKKQTAIVAITPTLQSFAQEYNFSTSTIYTDKIGN